MSGMYFQYFPAFLARVLDENNPNGTKVAIWIEHPASEHIKWSQKFTIVVDLSKTPNNESDWKSVEVDDYCNNEIPSRRGFTTLGPAAPHIYGAAGVYLSFQYIDKRRTEIDHALLGVHAKQVGARKTKKVYQGRDYELLAYATKEPGRIRRFHGFHQIKKVAQVDSRTSLLEVAHGGVSFEARAPRHLLARDSEIWRSPASLSLESRPSSGAAARSDDGSIFISIDLAREANLEVPKRPSGSGASPLRLEFSEPNSPTPLTAATRADIKAQTASPCSHVRSLVQGGPLNVIGHDAYDEVKAIRDKLSGNYICVSTPSLDHVLDIDGKFMSLDLIGHSTREGILKINELPLTPEVVPLLFTSDVVRHLRFLGIQEVRLLGCRTAVAPIAGDVARALHDCLNPPEMYSGRPIGIRATRADVFAVHYRSGDGFNEPRLLVGHEVMCNGAAGDLPPLDDSLDNASSSLATLPYDSQPLAPSMETFGLPRADEMLLEARMYQHWQNADPDYGGLFVFIDPTQPYNDTPVPRADVQVLVVDDGAVLAFEIVRAGPSETPFGLTFDRVRLSFRGAWQSYLIKEQGGPGTAADQLFAFCSAGTARTEPAATRQLMASRPKALTRPRNANRS